PLQFGATHASFCWKSCTRAGLAAGVLTRPALSSRSFANPGAMLFTPPPLASAKARRVRTPPLFSRLNIASRPRYSDRARSRYDAGGFLIRSRFQDRAMNAYMNGTP